MEAQIKKESERIVNQNDRIIASERDREMFFNAVFGISNPNQDLIKAAKKYKSRTRQ